MTIAGRFEEALLDADEPGLAGPELLPERLARAAARMLRVDGAGISLLDAAGQRVPLGASSDDASAAERLQFTSGGGPCMTAQETRQPVFAVEEDLLRRWPVFADLLLDGTPYRAVVALPLLPALAGDGAMDLFFIRPDEVTDLDVFEGPVGVVPMADVDTTCIIAASYGRKPGAWARARRSMTRKNSARLSN